MRHELARCPFCVESLVVLDDGRLETWTGTFDAPGEPCRHLAFACVTLTAESAPRHKEPPGECSRVWFWVRGRGWRRLPSDQYHRLYDYVLGIACDMMAEGERAPQTAYIVVGGTAMKREDEEPGSGEVTWMVPGIKGAIDGLLDGFALYSRKPEALVDEVKRLAGVSVRTGK